MNKPLPAPPRRYSLVENLNALTLLPTPPRQYEYDDLVESLSALALAGKKPTVKELPDLPAPQTNFVGGFNPLLALSAAPDSRRHPPPVPPPPGAARTAAPSEGKAPPPPPKQIPISIPMPVPQVDKQSLTMQYALGSIRLDTPTKPALAPPFTTPPRPNSNAIVSPKAASTPPLSAVTSPTSLPAVSVTPIRPRVVSAPLSSASSSPGRNTTQCSGTTKVGKQCSRQIKLPATHSFLDPTPALYCHQHKEVMISAQPGFYVQKAGSADRFVEFSHYIPHYLQMDTQLALKVEMEKRVSRADVSGYIYAFEILDPKRPDVIQLKVGRAVNLPKRIDQWSKQCGSKTQILRGWWPRTVEGGDGTGGSLLRGNIDPGERGPLCHRVERLVHIELTDLFLHTPYLDPGWPNNTAGPSPSASATSYARKSTTCLDCGVVHREIFTFSRPREGLYKEREWDLIVKPVIKKWGRFVKEYYT